MQRSKPTATPLLFFFFLFIKEGQINPQKARYFIVGNLDYLWSATIPESRQTVQDGARTFHWLVLLVGSAQFRQSTFSMDVSWRSFQGDTTLGKVSGKQVKIVSKLEGEKPDKNPAFQSGLIFNDLLPQGHINEFSS